MLFPGRIICGIGAGYVENYYGIGSYLVMITVTCTGLDGKRVHST